ncbi:TPA: hypothetical protein DIV48_02735 [Candidatus Kaiserbacteria bacterium]|nr:MAG: Glycoside hydrolase family protein [Parcubacteria group bacterium GW2011_GWA1_56_13]KKW46171.1 MAG: Glycoside hydrolase family protein [Parcubacteria group bacterium GW2011_GWB1_57_6]HCR52543.1 hypothetical protein [Candidatus Kaiserbacteria bacterium]
MPKKADAFLAIAVALFSQVNEAKDARTVTAWLHQRDWAAAVESVQQHAKLIAEVAPAWYMISPEGRVIAIPKAFVNDAQLVDIARANGIILRPLVGTADTKVESVLPILRDRARRAAHAKELADLVVWGHYDGIDLDYEGIRMPELEQLASLVEELAAALHREGKTLAVSLEVQGSDGVIPSWMRIGKVADSVRLMTYGSKPARPGPIMELDKMRLHLERALKAIPVQKLSHGIAIYGLDWSPNVGSGTWMQYQVRADEQRITPLVDAASKMSRYTDLRGIVQYENAQSVGEKVRIARALGIQKFAFWRLGGEDSGIWNLFRSP